jgi:hypothetical protein
MRTSTAQKSTTGSSNAYVLAAARTVTAYAQGDAYMFRANFTNTAAVTLNVDSVGAVAIVNNTQSALAAGQIQSVECTWWLTMRPIVNFS